MFSLEQLQLEGSLKTYEISGGFLNIYWSHPSLGSGVFVLFKFLKSTEKKHIFGALFIEI